VKYLATLCSSLRALVIAALAGSPIAAALPQAHAQTSADREAAEWNATVGVGTAAAYQHYLEQYPLGPHAGDAFRRMIELTIDPDATFGGPEAGPGGGISTSRGLGADLY
jgi:opacity protein-like surface antigen